MNSLNQLLILKHESFFDKVKNAADGAYYIESLTEQLAEKALVLFKEMEEKGGFLALLKEGVMTSSPGPTPAKINPKWRAAWPVLNATAYLSVKPRKSDTCFSNSPTAAPIPSQPISSASVTALNSLASMRGLKTGISKLSPP